MQHHFGYGWADSPTKGRCASATSWQLHGDRSQQSQGLGASPHPFLKPSQRLHGCVLDAGLPDMLPENQSLRERHAPMSEFIQQICQLKLDFPAGTGLQYQSTGLAILGEIVQRVSRISLKEFLRKEFFEPLGMKDTALGIDWLPEERVPNLKLPPEQEGVDWSWNSPYWRNLGAAWGGMFSTVEDLTHFLKMLLLKA